MGVETVSFVSLRFAKIVMYVSHTNWYEIMMCNISCRVRVCFGLPEIKELRFSEYYFLF